MAEQNLFLAISNPFMKWLLRTSLHGLVSKSTMLVTVTGSKTGKTITTPVNYLSDGDALWVISARLRTWWRNLRGGRPCTLRLRGQDVACRADVFEEDESVAAHLPRYIEINPAYASYLGIQRAADGTLEFASVQQSARNRVLIHFHPQ